MARIGMPLLVHGEVTDPEVDIFDREAVFIERVLAPLLRELPELAHRARARDDGGGRRSSSREAAERSAATITAHHLMLNRNALFVGGIRPHLYCLPIAQARGAPAGAACAAATSGSARFFLGTDSAPHAVATKEAACGCAGIFTAPAALELYAQVFEEEAALDRLEAFAALNGPALLPACRPTRSGWTLVREAWTVPASVPSGARRARCGPSWRARRWRGDSPDPCRSAGLLRPVTPGWRGA